MTPLIDLSVKYVGEFQKPGWWLTSHKPTRDPKRIALSLEFTVGMPGETT
jgi:hypothetical protein